MVFEGVRRSAKGALLPSQHPRAVLERPLPCVPLCFVKGLGY